MKKTKLSFETWLYMVKKEQMEKNRVIALFEGLELHNDDPEYGEVFRLPGDKLHISRYPVHELKYHSDWNWIMPVVKKIHNLVVAGDAINAITEEAIFTFSIFAPLNDVHLAAYQFIVWYNENVKK